MESKMCDSLDMLENLDLRLLLCHTCPYQTKEECLCFLSRDKTILDYTFPLDHDSSNWSNNSSLLLNSDDLTNSLSSVLPQPCYPNIVEAIHPDFSGKETMLNSGEESVEYIHEDNLNPIDQRFDEVTYHNGETNNTKMNDFKTNEEIDFVLQRNCGQSELILNGEMLPWNASTFVPFNGYDIPVNTINGYESVLNHWFLNDEVTNHMNAETNTEVLSSSSLGMPSDIHNAYNIDGFAITSNSQNYNTSQMISSVAKEETNDDGILPWKDPTFVSFKYCPKAREEARQRYFAKKMKLKFGKLIRYESRKSTADRKRRLKGRFAKAGAEYDYDPASNNHKKNMT